jgi:PAS domain S-box-containing protein
MSNEIKTVFKSSIGRDLVLQVFLSSLFVTALLSVLVSYVYYKKELTLIERRMDDIIDTQNDIISTAMWQFDEKALSAAAVGILHYQYFSYAAITLKDGMIISSGKRTKGKTIERNVPLHYQTPKGPIYVGSMFLQADVSRIIDQLKISIMTGILFLAGLILFIAALISYLFRRRAISHIIAIANFLRTKTVDAPFTQIGLVKKNVGDEIDFLADSFNTVLQNLHLTLDQISHREQQTRDLLAAARAIMEYSEFKVVARRLFDTCCRMTGAVSGYVALLDKDNNNKVLFLESGGLPCDVDLSLPMPIQGLRAVAYSEKRVVFENDFMNSPWVELMPKGHVDLRNVLFIPLIVDKEAVGLIGIANKPSDFTEEDVQIAGAIGDMASVCLQRSLTEAVLRESEIFFKETQNAAFIGSYKTDFVKGVWESSEVLDRIFGIGRDYVRSIDGWLDIVHPDDRNMMDHFLREEVIRNRKPFVKEYRIIRKSDNEIRWVYGLGRTDYNAKGNVVSLIGTIQDITERKRAEEEHLRLTEQLNQAQKMEYIGRLAGGIAHDFNNMLGAILGNVELILEKVAPSSPIHEGLCEIREAAGRSADLTRQLLAFARKQTVAPQILDLNQTVEGMLKMLRRMIGEDIHLVWIPGNHLKRVMMDSSQIDQILANLCVNARDAISGVGRISIKTENTPLDPAFCEKNNWAVPGDYVQLTVKDNGIGMTEETLSHLFEPFYSTKGVGKGTGLGLSTVYGIIKQNNGLIQVLSDIDHGTEFRIYFPVCEVLDEKKSKNESMSTTKPGVETVLIVEDEPQVLKMTSAMLKSQGYTVLTAENPGEAIIKARKYAGKIDLLITDVIMPDMNGLDLSKKLKSVNPGLKCLFMSGYTDDIISPHGVLNEDDYFIQKPFSKTNLIAKVKKALNDSAYNMQ